MAATSGSTNPHTKSTKLRHVTSARPSHLYRQQLLSQRLQLVSLQAGQRSQDKRNTKWKLASSSSASAANSSPDSVSSQMSCPFLRLASPPPSKGPLGMLLDLFKSIVAFIKLLFTYRTDIKTTLTMQTEALGGKAFVRSRFFAIPMLLVGDGPTAKSVMGNDADFPNDLPRAADLLGAEALLIQQGEAHSRIRRLMAPFFAAEQIGRYTPRVQSLATKYLDLLAERSARVADPAQGPPALPLMELFTLEVITRLVAGLGDVGEEQIAELRADYKAMSEGGTNPIAIDLPFLPYGQGLAARRRILARIDSWIEASRQRVAAGSRIHGVLDELVGHKDEQGAELTHAQLRDNMNLFLIAGFDNTAATITAMLHFLHGHPQYKAALVAEQQQVAAEFGNSLTWPALRSMAVADRFIKEVMRLRPVSALLMRVAAHDIRCSGLAAGEDVVRKGEFVAVALTYLNASDPQWAGREGELAPEVFNPDRWLEQGSVVGQLAFGHGKHSCLGMPLALMEAKTLLAVLLRGYEVEGVAEPRQWLYAPLIQPDNGLPLVIRKKA